MATYLASVSLGLLASAACGGSNTPLVVDNLATIAAEEREPNGRYFVVELTSLCPSPAEAIEGECGHTIEDASQGYQLARGTNLIVDGAESDEVWRSSRYMLEGILPGFVRASALSRRPKLEHVTTYRSAHPEAKVYSPQEIALGTDADGQLDYTLVFAGVAHKFGELYDDTDSVWSERHSCLIDACPELSYLCDDTYCDEILIEVGVNGDVATIVDRYGVFTAR